MTHYVILRSEATKNLIKAPSLMLRMTGYCMEKGEPKFRFAFCISKFQLGVTDGVSKNEIMRNLQNVNLIS